jgi:hypothetical protein
MNLLGASHFGKYLPMVRQLSAPDKLKLIRLLAEELDTNEDISPLEPHKVYYLPTPYDSFGAVRY